MVLASDKSSKPEAKPRLGAGPAVMWREPTDIASRNLFYGPGLIDRLAASDQCHQRRSSDFPITRDHQVPRSPLVFLRDLCGKGLGFRSRAMSAITAIFFRSVSSV